MKTAKRTTLRLHVNGELGNDTILIYVYRAKEEAPHYYLNRTWNIGTSNHPYYVMCYEVEVIEESII